MPLHRLLYTSKANLPPSHADVGARIRAIAEQSARRNSEAGITGILIFVEDEFIQVLEGELPAVESTFERICCSFDHRQLRIVDLVRVEERLFAEWGMTLLTADAEASVALRDDLQEIRFMMGMNARAATNLMRKCLKIHAIKEKAVAA